MADKRIGTKNLGSLYSGGRVRKRREWRGIEHVRSVSASESKSGSILLNRGKHHSDMGIASYYGLINLSRGRECVIPGVKCFRLFLKKL